MAKSKLNHPDEYYIAKLGARIKELRIKKGYTNYETFAFDHELGRAHYGKAEQGRNITFSTLTKILKALDISFEEFFSEGFK